MTMKRHVLLAALAAATQGLALQVPSSGAVVPAGSEGHHTYSHNAKSNLVRRQEENNIGSYIVSFDGETGSVPNYMHTHDGNPDGNLADKVAVEVSYDGDWGPGYMGRAMAPRDFERV